MRRCDDDDVGVGTYRNQDGYRGRLGVGLRGRCGSVHASWVGRRILVMHKPRRTDQALSAFRNAAVRRTGSVRETHEPESYSREIWPACAPSGEME
jgi:hypothetical protein